jgi:hypothetical protein
MNALAQLVGGVGALLIMVMFVCWFVLSLATPFMAFSAIKNLARIRRALERIADTNDLPSRAGGSGVLKL